MNKIKDLNEEEQSIMTDFFKVGQKHQDALPLENAPPPDENCPSLIQRPTNKFSIEKIAAPAVSPTSYVTNEFAKEDMAINLGLTPYLDGYGKEQQSCLGGWEPPHSGLEKRLLSNPMSIAASEPRNIQSQCDHLPLQTSPICQHHTLVISAEGPKGFISPNVNQQQPLHSGNPEAPLSSWFLRKPEFIRDAEVVPRPDQSVKVYIIVNMLSQGWGKIQSVEQAANIKIGPALRPRKRKLTGEPEEPPISLCSGPGYKNRRTYPPLEDTSLLQMKCYDSNTKKRVRAKHAMKLAEMLLEWRTNAPASVRVYLDCIYGRYWKLFGDTTVPWHPEFPQINTRQTQTETILDEETKVEFSSLPSYIKKRDNTEGQAYPKVEWGMTKKSVMEALKQQTTDGMNVGDPKGRFRHMQKFLAHDAAHEMLQYRHKMSDEARAWVVERLARYWFLYLGYRNTEVERNITISDHLTKGCDTRDLHM